jgi:predicted DNA-binding protein
MTTTESKIINLHLAKPFYDRMKAQADARGATVTGYIRVAIDSYVSAEDPRLQDLIDAYLACDDERREWLLGAADVARAASRPKRGRRRAEQAQ